MQLEPDRRTLLGSVSAFFCAGAEGAHVSRRSSGRPSTVGARAAALLLVCIGVALVVGAVASSASGPAVSFGAAKGHATGKGPNSIAVADLNADGRPDLATTNTGDGAPDECSATHSVSVLLNRAGGKFGPRRDSPTRRCPLAVAIGDLDGDGKPDLVSADWTDPDAGSSTVSVLLNLGGGSFAPKRDYPTGTGAASLAIADLNGDGALDVATGTGDAFGCGDVATVSVLINRGDGTLQAKHDYPTGRCPRVAVGDLDGDGAPDLVTANEGDGTLSVLINRGGGSFGAGQDYPARADSVAIGDVSGDGKPDLVGCCVSVLVNRGDGTFGSRRDYRTGLFAASVAIGDLNGDAAAEVVVANGFNSISVLPNRGDGRFLPRLEYRALKGGHQVSVAVADLSGDGRRDVVAADEAASSAYVFLNKPGLCNVQYVKGLRLAAARRELARANCRVGKVRRVQVKGWGKGRVIWQKPVFGAVRRGGARVGLVVSRGPR